MQSYTGINQNQALSSYSNIAKDLLQILGGSLFLSLASQISIPLMPVPLTMQTFAVMVLAITLGRVKGLLSVVAYIVESMLGLPVLANAASFPLAIVGAKGGYLFGFILQAYITGLLFEKTRSYGVMLVSLVMISALQLAMGACWLGSFIGLNAALTAGFFPFIPGEIIKCVSILAFFKKRAV